MRKKGGGGGGGAVFLNRQNSEGKYFSKVYFLYVNLCEVYSANTSSKLCEFNFQLNFRSILKREQKTRIVFWPYENMRDLLMVRPCVLINIIKCLKGL